MDTLIRPDQPWALWAVLLAAATFGFWAERTRWGGRLSGAVLAILATFVLSNLRIIPSQAPTYDVVWTFLVPLAIPLLLLRADLRRILREAGPTLFAFAAGGLGTVVGTLLAVRLVPLGEEAHKLAGIFCATYVGGSMNYAAVAEAVQLRSGDLLSAGIAADNLVMTLYFMVLFALPSIGALRRRYPRRAGIEQPGPVDARQAGIADHGRIRDASLVELGGALALGAALCAVGYAVAPLIGFPSGGILLVTALTVALATLFPAVLGSLRGADGLGTLLMQVFFAVIGASANVGVVLRAGPRLFVFAAAILAVHLLTILSIGRVLRLDLAEIVIASNANMGGPTTAAAMAVSRRWDALVLPAILCGTLGYSVATFLGVAVAGWLE